MQKRNSKLFDKFEDFKILNETAVNVTAGLLAEPTTDYCTGYGGSPDCGDVDYPVSKPQEDNIMTSAEFDTSCPK